MPATLTNGTKASRFELPLLNLDFGNITDGTNIPPPPDSPVQKVPTPPQTPPANSQDNKKIGNGPEVAKATPSNGNIAGTKRTADDDAPLSPAASSRQGSIRRLFSRNKLNNMYAEGQLASNGSISAASGIRPASSGTSFLDDRKSKRSSGWFRRITGDNKRASMVIEHPPSTPILKKPAGPPPPMIPELSDLEKDEGSLGSDLFKNIN